MPAATACEAAGEASPGKIKPFSSVNPAPGQALRRRAMQVAADETIE
jgi:hypothetical protein